MYIQQDKNDEQLENIFASISPQSKEYNIKNIQVDEYNRFVSVICPICNVIKIQNRCLHEVENGFIYDGKSICAKAFCAPGGSS